MRETASGRRQAPRNVASSLDSARELGIRDAQGSKLVCITAVASLHGVRTKVAGRSETSLQSIGRGRRHGGSSTPSSAGSLTRSPKVTSGTQPGWIPTSGLGNVWSIEPGFPFRLPQMDPRSWRFDVGVALATSLPSATRRSGGFQVRIGPFVPWKPPDIDPLRHPHVVFSVDR